MSLIAWYKLDGNANDSSGNGLHATPYNITYTSGKFGQSATFNNSTSYLNAGNNSLLMPNSITISAWIKLTDTSSWMLINKAAGGVSGSYYIYGDSNASCTWSIFGPTGARYNVSTGSLNLNQWYHITATFNHLTGIQKIYRDGIFIQQTTGAALGNNSADVLIGRYTSGYFLGGQIADLRIYNEELSPKEIKLLSQAKILHYNFPLIQNTIELDISGYENNGTLVGSFSNTTETNLRSNARVFSNSYINTNKNLTFLRGDQDITISAWVYPTSFANGWHGIFSTMSSWGTGFSMQIGTSQRIALMIQGTYLTTSWTPSINTWYHIVGTRNSSTGVNKLYVNGILENQSTIATVTYQDTNMMVGVFYTSPSLTYTGRMSDFRIYGTELSINDVQALYQERASIDNFGNFLTNEIIELPYNGMPPLDQWAYGGGAYYSNGEGILPTQGSYIESPLIYVGTAPTWWWTNEFYSEVGIPSNPTFGGHLQGSSYFAIDKTTPTENTGGYTGNGHAGTYALSTWTKKTWSYVAGNSVRYIRFVYSTSSTYNGVPYKVRNPILTVNGSTELIDTYVNDSIELLQTQENFKISNKSQALAVEFDEVSKTSNNQAAELTKTGIFYINGEFNEVD